MDIYFNIIKIRNKNDTIGKIQTKLKNIYNLKKSGKMLNTVEIEYVEKYITDNITKYGKNAKIKKKLDTLRHFILFGCQEIIVRYEGNRGYCNTNEINISDIILNNIKEDIKYLKSTIELTEKKIKCKILFSLNVSVKSFEYDKFHYEIKMSEQKDISIIDYIPT